MVDTGIDLIRYKMTALGGQVGTGKTYIMGLFVDELIDIGKSVCYMSVGNIGYHKFDSTHPNVSTFVYSTAYDIIEFYERLNETNEEIYVLIDGIGAIDLRQQYDTESTYEMKISHFLRKLKGFENIKTVFNFTYNGQNAILYRNYHLHYADLFVGVKRVRNEVNGCEYKYDIYLNDKFLCRMSDLISDPKLRRRERKISKLVD